MPLHRSFYENLWSSSNRVTRDSDSQSWTFCFLIFLWGKSSHCYHLYILIGQGYLQLEMAVGWLEFPVGLIQISFSLLQGLIWKIFHFLIVIVRILLARRFLSLLETSITILRSSMKLLFLIVHFPIIEIRIFQSSFKGFAGDSAIIVTSRCSNFFVIGSCYW